MPRTIFSTSIPLLHYGPAFRSLHYPCFSAVSFPVLRDPPIALNTKEMSTGSHLWIWELDHKESWAPKNWCFSTVVLKKTLESPLDCKEIQPVHPKGDQSWIFIGKTDAEVEVLIPWSPDVKSWHTRKDSEAGNDWKAGGEGDDRGWDGWMASPTQWTWVRVNSGSWWWLGRPGVLQSLGSQRVGHHWAAELMMNWFLPCFPWNPTRIPFNSWDPSPLEKFCHLPSVNTSFQISDLLILPLQWEQKTN